MYSWNINKRYNYKLVCFGISLKRLLFVGFIFLKQVFVRDTLFQYDLCNGYGMCHQKASLHLAYIASLCEQHAYNWQSETLLMERTREFWNMRSFFPSFKKWFYGCRVYDGTWNRIGWKWAVLIRMLCGTYHRCCDVFLNIKYFIQI